MRRKLPKIVNGKEVWQCSTCREWKPREDFYRCSRRWNGLKAQCRRCHVECAVATRDEDNKRDNNAKWMRADRERKPEKYRKRERLAARRRKPSRKIKARTILNKAVCRGDVVRPTRCSECNTEGKVTGHHSDYSKPLEVEWLCYRCHGRRHRKAAALGLDHRTRRGGP